MSALPTCLICQRPVPDYNPDYCCSGFDCACQGQPAQPCICSDECWDALTKRVGEFDERRIKAGIVLYLQPDAAGVTKEPETTT